MQLGAPLLAHAGPTRARAVAGHPCSARGPRPRLPAPAAVRVRAAPRVRSQALRLPGPPQPGPQDALGPGSARSPATLPRACPRPVLRPAPVPVPALLPCCARGLGPAGWGLRGRAARPGCRKCQRTRIGRARRSEGAAEGGGGRGTRARRPQNPGRIGRAGAGAGGPRFPQEPAHSSRSGLARPPPRAHVQPRPGGQEGRVTVSGVTHRGGQCPPQCQQPLEGGRIPPRNPPVPPAHRHPLPGF